jgi:hypothetical protein
MNKLIKASVRTVEFIEENREKFKYLPDHIRMADIIWRAIKADETIGIPISTGFLCSDITFTRRLPDYCERQNLFFEPEPIVIVG